MSQEATLRDGRRVRLQPIGPESRKHLIAGFHRMSETSRYFRFLHAKHDLSEAELDYLTRLDYHDHFAWGAVSLAEPDEPGVGVSRYVRDTHHPDVAEVAVTVIDDYQGVGLGRILLRVLARTALENGVARFHANVHPENVPGRRLFEGSTLRPPGRDEGMLVLDLSVAALAGDR